ncbi:DUF885 family protein [Metamycoplasma neophronis]|uniref:DUF885 family protein n=1 Tax=Metamycoplasma neophronis TaxID=872983 RepID=A0ABY2YZX7_9BACT|nr:DUF885 family protein [Metamycoplasma neophronis]TPR54045.1 DUF885 family protein [Metamycoplasma neophronis]
MNKKSKIILGAAVSAAVILPVGLPLLAMGIQKGMEKHDSKKIEMVNSVLSSINEAEASQYAPEDFKALNEAAEQLKSDIKGRKGSFNKKLSELKTRIDELKNTINTNKEESLLKVKVAAYDLEEYKAAKNTEVSNKEKIDKYYRAIALAENNLKKPDIIESDIEKNKNLIEKAKAIIAETEQNQQENFNKFKALFEIQSEIANHKWNLSALSTEEKEKIQKITSDYITNFKKLSGVLEAEEFKNLNKNYPTEEEAQKIVDFYKSQIEILNRIDENNLNAITLAWVKGLKYSYEISISNYASKGRYILSYYKLGPENAYPANSFYDNFFRMTEENAEPALRNLKEAVRDNVVVSRLVIKSNLASILNRWLKKQVDDFLNDDQLQEISLVELIEKNTEPSYQKKLAFYKYYANEYFKASKFGVDENQPELKLYKTNTINEVQNTLEWNHNKQIVKIYGLGYTEAEINAKGVGLSSIQGNPNTTDGGQLYQAILKMATTTDETANEVFQSGYELTKKATKNMTKVASEVANLIAGENGAWNATFLYDEDGIGGNDAKEVTLEIRNANGEINIVNFNKWLNQEQFYFGREGAAFYDEAKISELDNDETLAKAKTELAANGYAFLKDNNDKYGSITNKQFYYGALEAFKAYQQFKAATEQEGYQYFAKQVGEYGVSTYKYAGRQNAGGGAYDRRKGSFFFNADPYYGLPKWSITTFANHESVMGHHNQVKYAEKFLASFNDQNIGNIFKYTSYAEGWALFMEWFAVEAGYYGTPDYNNETDYYSAPVDFSYSRGITNFFTKEAAQSEDAVTDDMINQIKNLHGGVYWKLSDSITASSNDKTHAQKAVKLANLLQYYGSLNDAQLRNMRRAVDPALHGFGIEGKADLGPQASLEDVKNFILNNSASSLGNAESEARRYLMAPGQATSYNAGKEVFIKLYDKVRKQSGLSREEFVNKVSGFTIEGVEYPSVKHGKIQELLEYILMNGALPLSAVEDVVNKAYKLN